MAHYLLMIGYWLVLSVNLAQAQDFRSTLSPPGWILPNATIDYDFANGRYWNAGKIASVNQIFTTTRATAATCTSVGGALSYVPANTPCITDNGYQSYVAATNLILQSQFAATWTATRSTLTANTVTSPDGTTDAATLIEDSTATNTHLATQAVTKAASSILYEFSVYAKSSTRTRIDLQMDDGSGNGAIMVCDLAGQQVGVSTAGVGTPFTTLATEVIAYPNGWTRCGVIATTNTATTVQGTVFLDSGSGTAAKSNSYSGDGASGAIIFGAQLEVLNTGLQNATPYIPTTTASATRNADVMTAATTAVTGSSGYTVYVSYQTRTVLTNNATQDVFHFDDNTNNNRLLFRRTATTGVPSIILIIGGVTQYTTTMGSGFGAFVNAQMATAQTTNLQRASTNTVIGTDTTNASILTSAITTMHFGSSAAPNQQCFCYIKRVAVLSRYFYGNIQDLTIR